MLANKFAIAGLHLKSFIAKSTLPRGVYFYRIQTENFTSSKKLVLLK